MDHSLFYLEKFVRPFPVSMLLLEVLGVKILEQRALEEQGETSQDFQTLVTDALKVCEVRNKPSRDDILYVHTRMQAMEQEFQEEKQKPPTPGSNKKTFASDYLKWLTTLDHAGMCHHVAEYDHEKAQYLYSAVDRDDVLRISKQKADSEWHDKLAQFEACLFGFGGGYGDSAEDRTYDLKEDRAAAEASIRSMGF